MFLVFYLWIPFSSCLRFFKQIEPHEVSMPLHLFPNRSCTSGLHPSIVQIPDEGGVNLTSRNTCTHVSLTPESGLSAAGEMHSGLCPTARRDLRSLLWSAAALELITAYRVIGNDALSTSYRLSSRDWSNLKTEGWRTMKRMRRRKRRRQSSSLIVLEGLLLCFVHSSFSCILDRCRAGENKIWLCFSVTTDVSPSTPSFRWPQVNIYCKRKDNSVGGVQYLFQPGDYAVIVEHVIAWKLPHIFANTVIFFTHWTFQSWNWKMGKVQNIPKTLCRSDPEVLQVLAWSNFWQEVWPTINFKGSLTASTSIVNVLWVCSIKTWEVIILCYQLKLIVPVYHCD